MKDRITKLQKRIKAIVDKAGLAQADKELSKLEAKSNKEGFWKNSAKAKQIMQKIGDLKRHIESVEGLKKKSKDIEELAELASQDESMQKEVEAELKNLEKEVAKKEIETFLSGKYDKGNAIISIFAGQGGTEACDWTEMLLRMYLKFIESMGWKADVVNMVKGEEAGYSSVTIEVYGLYAYGYLKHETGTHRLVRISPFNAQNLRQTSFAGVEVLPLMDEEETEIEIKPDDIIFKTSRSGGKGGQGVNKVNTKVTIVHKETGIQVTCQSERSQLQNRKAAMRLLRAKLYQKELEKRAQEKKELKGEHKIPTWGNQIRNYVLHPYKLVKDLRTGVESKDPDSVLDGNLVKFVEASVRKL